jgi:hypothetical protein
MDDPTSLRSKADASLRLAELARTPRARELFRELADAYERRARGELTAELIEQAAAAPALAPVAPLVADVPIVADAPATADMQTDVDALPVVDVPVAPMAADLPLIPDVPLAESDQFIADLKALREEASRD